MFVHLRGRSELVADAWSGREVRSEIAGRRMPTLNARRTEATKRNLSLPVAAYVSMVRD